MPLKFCLVCFIFVFFALHPASAMAEAGMPKALTSSLTTTNLQPKTHHHSIPPSPSKKEGDWEALKTQTFYLNAIFIATNGVLWFLPESVSKWSDEDKRDLLGSWSRNVKAGPVQDTDNFFFNWITHPYAGAAYYMMAKKTSFSWQKSCLYSAAVSTFMWEYGWEAFIETPSTIDIWVTPVLGCPLGEVFYRWDRAILRNEGEVFHSRALGSVIRFSLDPLGYATRFLQKTFEGKLELKLGANSGAERRQSRASEREASTTNWQLVLHF